MAFEFEGVDETSPEIGKAGAEEEGVYSGTIIGTWHSARRKSGRRIHPNINQLRPGAGTASSNCQLLGQRRGRMPVFHTKTIESILEPVAQQVTSSFYKYQKYQIII